MDIDVPTTFEDRDWEQRAPEQPLRFATIGCGWFGGEVGPEAMAESDYCELTVTVSSEAATAEDVAETYGADHAITYDEFEAGAAVNAYDAVYIATPNALHLPYAEIAAGHGKHVLCEKPLEATAERAQQMVDACETAGVRLMTAYRMQAARSTRWLRSLIDDGVIGDPVQVHGAFAFPMFPGGDPDQWRLDHDRSGGGALMDIGVYPLNTARYLLDADPIAVQATVTGDREEFADVDEHVAFQLEFPDEVTASCTASFNGSGDNRLSIMGTEGHVRTYDVFDMDADRELEVIRWGGGATVAADEPSEIVEEFDYFATAVRNDRPIEPDGEDGVVDLEVMEAVYESAETGRRIEL